ncbi:transferase 1, rSAM/selenodomain-associated [Anaerohalosphaera lusitana]|uniref:Transferase 1, rSAM/selenodomain-associated n=1 Tax=Anaerohalosphaera lusitana TaxID=1936003 RepID=A0A1U9NNP8_9BACT|nr:TIGR04282 family arsenosugar biosynthesis glycosyltransferase [Anaerohalosphaera lusitana]AQT69240.1 transferase 1, rSAM/selenodomain-associated [Anaerohalosphaera lusitana]
MSTHKGNCTAIFVKYPEPGKVKTRLGNQIGHDQAAELYGNFVLDMIDVYRQADCHLRIFVDPSSDRELYREWLGDDLTYAAQTGKGLGERMLNAFEEMFAEGFSKAILTGSDIPDLTVQTINDAFTALSENDVVLGPSSDGGYYLIGFREASFVKEVFKGISWSTDSVLDETLSKFTEHALSEHILDLWHDIDTKEDLIELISRNKDTAFMDSRTVRYLHQHTDITFAEH